VVNQVIKNRRIQNRRRIELLAGNRRSDDGKNARANDRTNAERRERPGAECLLEAVLGRL
jgi:hypothetical protein